MIVISILIHFVVIFVYKLSEQEDDKKEKNYTEVEYLPNEEQQQADMPLQTIPRELLEPIDDDRETTLDHDLLTTDKKGKANDSTDLFDENIFSQKEESIDKTADLATIYRPDLFNTKEITERIARKRSIDTTGEDTASYNKFEEKYASYFGKFRRRIYQIWTYPQEAISRGETGVVAVRFSILKDGSIVNIKMLKSSGYHSLDREVMRVLKSFGKLPLPKSYKLNQLNVEEAYFFYNSNEDINRWIR